MLPSRVVALAILGCVASVAVAEPPQVASIFPLAIRPGASTTLTLRGEALDAEPRLWLGADATAKLVSAAGASAQFEASCAATEPIGVIGARLHSRGGADSLRLLLVDDLPSVVVEKPRTSTETARSIAPPVAVDAIYAARTFDYYRFEASAGQTITVELVARRLGSPLDGFVRLLDEAGRQIAYADDTPGLSGDCRFRARIPADGDYFLEVRDVRYDGGDDHFYRLRVGDFPLSSVPYPPVVMAADGNDRRRQRNCSTAGEAGSGWSSIDVSSGVEWVEVEPNDAAEQASALPGRGGVSGRFLAVGDVDFFRFAAKEKEPFRFRGVTRSLGSPADLLMRVLDAEGKELAAVDDDGVDEGVLDFEAPAEGEYLLAVEELNRRAGLEFVYRVTTGESRTPFTLQVDSDAYTAPVGGYVQIQATVKRQGFDGPIEVQASGAGGRIGAGVIAENENEVSLQVALSSNLTPGELLELSVAGVAEVDGAPYIAEATCHDAVRERLNKLRYPPEDLLHTLVVGVAEPYPPFLTANVEAPRIEVVQGSSAATVDVNVGRLDGFQGAVQLSLASAAPGLAAEAVDVEQGDRGTLQLMLPTGMPLGESAFSVRAAAHHRAQPGEAIVEGLTLAVAPAVVLGVAEVAASPSGEAVVQVSLNRRAAGPVTLRWIHLPDRAASAGETTIAEDVETATLVVDARAVRYWAGAELTGLLSAIVEIEGRQVQAAVVEIDLSPAVRAIAAQRDAARQASK